MVKVTVWPSVVEASSERPKEKPSGRVSRTWPKAPRPETEISTSSSAPVITGLVEKDLVALCSLAFTASGSNSDRPATPTIARTPSSISAFLTKFLTPSCFAFLLSILRRAISRTSSSSWP